jgi:hypothetical protein
MRRRIFTEAERRCLERWLREDVETQLTLTTLSRIRREWPNLAEDLELLFKAIRKMQRLRRWRGRRRLDEFGSALRCAESALTRARRELATSGGLRR